MRNTLIMVALAVLAVASGIMSRRPSADAPAPRAAQTGPLGHYVRGAGLVGTDDEGRVAYRVFAERLDEHPGAGQLTLTDVTIEYTPVDETPWRITAASGNAPKDLSQFVLTGGVELASMPTDDAAPQQVVTERLEFWPDSSRVEADELVRVRIGDWQLEAGKLRADLKGDTLTLESNGHGKFAP